MAWLQIVQLIFSILTILCAICVLIAIWMKSKSGLLLPWLINHAVLAVIGSVYKFYNAVLHYKEQDTAMGIRYSVACVGIAGTIYTSCWISLTFLTHFCLRLVNYFSINRCRTYNLTCSCFYFTIAVMGSTFWWVIFSYYQELSEVDLKNKNKANSSEGTGM